MNKLNIYVDFQTCVCYHTFIQTYSNICWLLPISYPLSYMDLMAPYIGVHKVRQIIIKARLDGNVSQHALVWMELYPRMPQSAWNCIPECLMFDEVIYQTAHFSIPYNRAVFLIYMHTYCWWCSNPGMPPAWWDDMKFTIPARICIPSSYPRMHKVWSGHIPACLSIKNCYPSMIQDSYGDIPASLWFYIQASLGWVKVASHHNSHELQYDYIPVRLNAW